MADDIDEPFEIDELAKLKTSTPRKKDTTSSENSKTSIENKKRRKEDTKEKDTGEKNKEKTSKSKESKNEGNNEKISKSKRDKTSKPNNKSEILEEESTDKKSKSTRNKANKTENTEIQEDEKKEKKTKKARELDGESVVMKEKENKKHKTSKENIVDNENDDDESDEEDTEMTEEEKEDMYNAVRNGDFVGLHNALDKKNADINMKWYGENLLMAAIRAGQTNIAEFLIDIGIDQNFKAKYFNLREKDKKGKRVDCHEKSCRDLAYDLGNDHIVEVIDVKNNNVFPFVPVSPRTIWQRRPDAPKLPKHLRPNSEDDSDEEDETTDDDENSKEDELDSGHPSARSHEKINDDFAFSEMLDKMNNNKDEGYGTMSPSGSPYLVHSNSNIQPEKPRLFYRPTKASMAVQTHNFQNYRRRAPSRSAPSMRNINIIGSYAHEKKQWEPKREKSDVSDTISVYSLPSLRFIPSSSKNTSRRSSTKLSAVMEISKILSQSPLLAINNEKENPFRSTQRSKSDIPIQKISQWCHNSTNVFDRLSVTKTSTKNRLSKFSVNRELIHNHRR